MGCRSGFSPTSGRVLSQRSPSPQRGGRDSTSGGSFQTFQTAFPPLAIFAVFARVISSPGTDRRAKARPTALYVATGFDVVAVRIENKSAVVLLVIVRPRSRSAVVAATCSHRRLVERVDE